MTREELEDWKKFINSKSPFERYGIKKNIPEPYFTMYLDGYTPKEILYAANKKIMNDYIRIEEAKLNENSDEEYIFTVDRKVKIK